MMISKGEINQVFKAYEAQKARQRDREVGGTDGVKKVKVKESRPASKASEAARADKVELSEWAVQIRAIKDKVARIPEIREDKVRQLAEAIESGKYHVSGGEIAEKMLGRLLGDSLE